ncbi:unnamed protein product [Paramecium sonneborni]|uniref:Uncharacterized protein n=1 Tax=Paramecium sonneborni TaxID=65129 RepID=A0A8S1N3P7_9CILI|nr:unnamed protein product [Paramecium sonneborni]
MRNHIQTKHISLLKNEQQYQEYNHGGLNYDYMSQSSKYLRSEYQPKIQSFLSHNQLEQKFLFQDFISEITDKIFNDENLHNLKLCFQGLRNTKLNEDGLFQKYSRD